MQAGRLCPAFHEREPMRLSTSEWRIVQRLDDAAKRRVARALGTGLVWLAAAALLALSAYECVRIQREAAQHQLTVQEVVTPQFKGLPLGEASAKHAAVVSITMRGALVVLYFFLASFLVSLAIGMRIYKRQDALAARLVQRLRELGELD